MSSLRVVTLFILILGGLSLGLRCLVGVDGIESLLDAGTPLARFADGLVGLSALYQIGWLVRLLAHGSEDEVLRANRLER